MVASILFDDFKQTLPDVSGKVFCITGTTSGTGFVAARTAAEKGGTVVLLNRKSQRVDDSLAKLKEAVPDGTFVSIECDLQSFESVRQAAAEIKSKYSKIYCLANNAGIMATPDEATEDGYDTQMQTNHLSHFLLTQELFPLLQAEAEASGDARIVNHSSDGRLWTPNKKLEQKYLEKNGGNLGGNSLYMMGGACFHRYFQTKLANSVFTYALAEKLKASNSKVKAIACHPGGSETNLGLHLQESFFMNLIGKVFLYFLMQSAEDGSMGLLKGMMAPDAETGTLYGPKGLKGPAVAIPPKPFENDPEAMSMLWKCSEEATGVKFDI